MNYSKQTQSNPILSAFYPPTVGRRTCPPPADSKGTFAQSRGLLTESGQAGDKLFRRVFFCCVPVGCGVFVFEEDFEVLLIYCAISINIAEQITLR